MRTATGGNVQMWRAIFSARARSCACGTTSLMSPMRSASEKTYSEMEEKKKQKTRGSAVPLHVKGYPLKLDALLS